MRLITLIIAVSLAGCASNSNLNAEKKKRIALEKRMDTLEKRTSTIVYKAVKLGENQMVQEIKAQVYKEVNDSLVKDKAFVQKILTKITKNFEQYKEIIGKVIAGQLNDLKSKVGQEVETALSNGTFIQDLEERITNNLKGYTLSVYKTEKAMIIKKCVSDALDQIVVKQIGINESKIKVIN